MEKSLQQNLFQAGHFAKGVIYGLLGFFAFASLWDITSGSVGKKGVIQSILEQPFGQAILVILVIGLLAYTFWRWVDAYETNQEEDDVKKEWVLPIAYVFSGVTYLSLAVYAIHLIAQGSQSSNGNGKQDLVATILQQSWGQIVIILLGVIIAGVAIYQLLKSNGGKFMEHINFGDATAKERKTFRWMGKTGLIARAIVFFIIAYLLILAGIQSDPSEVVGTGGALQFMRSLSYGWILMSITGLGLLFYGVFMVVKSRYGRA